MGRRSTGSGSSPRRPRRGDVGASICRRIMGAHGGDIALEATGGRGATFVLRFPAG